MQIVRSMSTSSMHKPTYRRFRDSAWRISSQCNLTSSSEVSKSNDDPPPEMDWQRAIHASRLFSTARTQLRTKSLRVLLIRVSMAIVCSLDTFEAFETPAGNRAILIFKESIRISQAVNIALPAHVISAYLPSSAPANDSSLITYYWARAEAPLFRAALSGSINTLLQKVVAW